MITTDTILSQQARDDLAVAQKAAKMALWIAQTTTSPLTKLWAEEEHAYWALRAESDKGLISQGE